MKKGLVVVAATLPVALVGMGVVRNRYANAKRRGKLRTTGLGRRRSAPRILRGLGRRRAK